VGLHVRFLDRMLRLTTRRNFVNYGLEHWGSDQHGVDYTRRFLLEWLSFLHRLVPRDRHRAAVLFLNHSEFLCSYVPVGLLEVVPQQLNDRPPAYFGRNDLETLMGSPNVSPPVLEVSAEDH
jgi:tRNA-dihydrouridine synthase 3